jgi:hypothetical protein
MTSGGATPANDERVRSTVAAEVDGHQAEEPARMSKTRRAGGLHQPEPVAVTWDERLRRPSAFIWRGARYRIARTVELWIVETGWWNDETHVSRSYSRVEAEGRLFDLCYDRLTKAWSLERALN